MIGLKHGVFREPDAQIFSSESIITVAIRCIHTWIGNKNFNKN